MTRIAELIGNEDVLRTVLDGFLAHWEGAYDVKPAETPNPTEYMFNPKRGHAELCQLMKSKPAWQQLCIQCDGEHEAMAKASGKPIHYLCHAGLLDIAVPIALKGELLATIFCGQCRSWDADVEREGRRRAQDTARRLGIDQDEFLELRERSRVVSQAEVEDVEQRLVKVATYMAATGQEKLELTQMRNQILREGELIQSVMTSLATIVDVDEFWPRLDTAMGRICKTIGASHAAVFVRDGKRGAYRLRSAAGMPHRGLRRVYSGDTSEFDRVVEAGLPKVGMPDLSRPNTYGRAVIAPLAASPDKVAMIPFTLSPESPALMLFYLNELEDKRGSLPVEKEADLLLRVAPQIATAYQNCVLYTRRRELAREKDVFIGDIAHQLISPISSMHDDSDRLYRRLDTWTRDRIDKQVMAIRLTSRWTARLARNLTWVATKGGHGLTKRPTSMTGLLIGCAIDVQGIAAYKAIRVNVDKARTDKIPDLYIDRDRFSQVVVNLLDNAVKYGIRSSEVLTDAEQVGSEVHIRVSNYGIPLRAADKERIFKRGERTREAQDLVPNGTGIGLYVARQIVELHGGTLYAMPSTFDEDHQADRVVFTIALPARA
jgi:signal transduction histidine kinase/ligand-binding sensor protein